MFDVSSNILYIGQLSQEDDNSIQNFIIRKLYNSGYDNLLVHTGDFLFDELYIYNISPVQQTHIRLILATLGEEFEIFLYDNIVKANPIKPVTVRLNRKYNQESMLDADNFFVVKNLSNLKETSHVSKMLVAEGIKDQFLFYTLDYIWLYYFDNIHLSPRSKSNIRFSISNKKLIFKQAATDQDQSFYRKQVIKQHKILKHVD